MADGGAGTAPEDALREFVVVLRAPSSARFLPEEGFELNLEQAEESDPPSVRLRMYSRWVPSGHLEPLPRELVIEVRGWAPSIDEAIVRFAGIARPMATLIAFVANVRVGLTEVHLAYDCSPDSDERQFVETFIPDESGGVAEGRIVRVHLMVAASQALLGTDPDRQQRLDRALRQYELALREWFVGGEWLALSHLYMAVDTLTPALIEKLMADRGLSKEELAQSVNIDPHDPKRPRWRQALGVWCRAELIFAGDPETYQAAKTASDGLEHGSLDLNEVHTHAMKATDKTFAYVRNAIVDLLELIPGLRVELLSIRPKDVQSRRKIVRGRLLGAAEDPAPDDERYPRLAWSSSVDSVLREGSSFTLKDQDKITVRTRPGVGFQLERLEIVGRLEDGQAPIQLDDKDIQVVSSSAYREAKELLAALMPIVDAAAATGADAAQVFPRPLAFNLFGQGTSFFQSAQTLIEAFQPVEALLPLRGLVIIAAHFEQMTKIGGPGVGLAARLAIDSLTREFGEATDLSRLDLEAHERAMATCREWVDAAGTLGVTLPDQAPPPDTSDLWTSLGAEMRLARQVIDVSYVTTALHVEPGDMPDRIGFRTKLEPGPLSDMIATAAVIAQLDLVKKSAVVFDWMIDEGRIEDLLAEARALNEAAANLHYETGQ